MMPAKSRSVPHKMNKKTMSLTEKRFPLDSIEKEILHFKYSLGYECHYATEPGYPQVM